ncbi:MAG TPA: type IV pilus twitching motility protein PilT [Methylomirabilota bacterium]|jgi:twitching motility protein PilT|nr:type IV pilus twitching motility protein PilT [Methylomirabilota bacterium]
MDVADLLIQTKERGASDLHLSAGSKPLMRLHGELTPIDNEPLSKDAVHRMVYEILNDDQRRQFEESRDLDFAIELGDIARFRVNVFNQRNGEGAVFRVIPTQLRTLQELGMPEVIQALAARENGLVLVTGPTGSGKSTTLAAMIDLINSTTRKHIITLEDPIEFVHRSKTSLVNQREIGPHTKSFASALRAALREDPDVILVGEMRDLETISLALTAAETGHLVFGTLHTKSAPKTIDRVIDAFPPGQQQQIRVQLAEALQGVVSQLLLPTKDKKGRVAALEIMVATVAIRNLIREAKTHQMPSAIQTGTQLGMQSLEQALKTLLMQGRVDRAHAESILLSSTAGQAGFGGSAGAPAAAAAR